MDNSRYNILIVDDGQDDHFFLKTALREVMPQAEVHSLYDGSEALAYLDTCKTLPHVIFLDLNMAKTCGKKTTVLIRHDQRFHQVPVIILTTSDGRGKEKSELISLGANDFYTKPLNMEGLIAIVQTVKNNWLNVLNYS